VHGVCRQQLIEAKKQQQADASRLAKEKLEEAKEAKKPGAGVAGGRQGAGAKQLGALTSRLVASSAARKAASTDIRQNASKPSVQSKVMTGKT
jgi:hypothetical protein